MVRGFGGEPAGLTGPALNDKITDRLPGLRNPFERWAFEALRGPWATIEAPAERARERGEVDSE